MQSLGGKQRQRARSSLGGPGAYKRIPRSSAAGVPIVGGQLLCPFFCFALSISAAVSGASGEDDPKVHMLAGVWEGDYTRRDSGHLQSSDSQMSHEFRFAQEVEHGNWA
ncbi:hypothetical protein Taro_000048 [Colocasia esculenta]|uniref:Uncharacterized protein n=1 Tax=Colocasia esculenta TaxID=4460 RepID=A0A843TDP2_COLES|nr:hypothetical protein [Colocasia esculenta]